MDPHLPADTEQPDASSLADEAPVGLGVATLDGHLLWANGALAELLGSEDPASLRGTSLAELHPEPARVADILRDRLEEHGRIRHLELEARRVDGSTLTVRVDAVVRDDAGPRSVIFSAVPVGAPRASFEQLGRNQKVEALERFAAGVAHDYNNLLTTIIAETSQMLAELTPATEAHESARTIMRGARRAAEITGRLLLFSRAEAGRPEVIDLNERIRAQQADLERTMTRGSELSMRLDPGVGPVRMDPAHLDVIVTNLVANAAEAASDGGRVVVETSMSTVPADIAGLDFHPDVPPGRYAALTVEDDGKGMDERTLDRALDPFFTTKMAGGGAGLGLTIVYGLAVRASGYVALRSAPGTGTLVRLLLPLTDAPVEAEPLPDGETVSVGPKRQARLLVVDDEGPVLRVMCKILRRAGYLVHPAGGAVEAQEEIQRRGCDIDLLLSDVMMPGMNGTELAEWVQERCPATVVLLVSGYADSDHVRDWHDRDPESLLAKPFEPAELLARVARRLSGQAAEPDRPRPAADDPPARDRP